MARLGNSLPSKERRHLMTVPTVARGRIWEFYSAVRSLPVADNYRPSGSGAFPLKRVAKPPPKSPGSQNH